MEIEINTEKSKSYEFGEFHLRGALKELQRGSESVEIQRRVLDLLTFLVVNRDRTVSKDEIQDAVWPGTVVTEAALTRAVMKARRALDDDATQQRFIKTIHGQGYRFIAQVYERDETGTQQTVDRVERRQALLRVATTYGAGAWLINQGAAMVWEAFEWVRWPQQILLAISVLGFPLALAFTWFYRTSPGGVILRSEDRSGLSGRAKTHWERPVIFMLVVGLGLSVFWNLRSEPAQPPSVARVAVLPISNMTGDANLSWLSLGMLSLLNTQLTDAQIPAVSASKIMTSVADPVAQVSEDMLKQLRLTQGAEFVFNIGVASAGEEFRTVGAYFDAGQRFELPSFTGATPVAAVRALGRYMVDMFVTQKTNTETIIASGDVFVDQAFARGMHELLSGNQKRARDLLEVAANAAPDSFWPNYELAVALRGLGDLDGARQRHLLLLQKAKADAVALQVALLSNDLGIIGDLSGELDTAEAHYQEGLQWAEEAGLHDRRAALLINFAILERARANPVKTQTLLGQALTAYQDAGIELVPGDFYITLGNAAADAGDYKGAQTQYRQGLNNFRAVNYARGEGIALSNLSWASEQLGDMPAAFQYLQESEELRARIDDKVGVIRSKIRRTDLYYSTGQLDQVEQLASEIAETEYAQNETEILATTYRFQAAVASDRSQPDAALQWYQRAIALDQAGGRVRAVCASRIGVASTLLQQQQFADALAELEALVEVSQAKSLANIELQAHRIKASVIQQQGQTGNAELLFKDVANQARKLGDDLELTKVAVELADIYYRSQDLNALEAWVGVAHDIRPEYAPVKLAQAQLAVLKQNFTLAKTFIEEAQALQGERVAKDSQRLIADMLRLGGTLSPAT